MALAWLVEHEIGLTLSPTTLTFKEREAIKFVSAYTRLYDEQCRDEIKRLTNKQ